MRAAMYVVLALVLAIGTMALAEPTINIYANAASYQPGDSIEVSLSSENGDEAIFVDVYVGVILPDGDIWSAQYAGWSHSIDPWMLDTYVPASFDMAPTVFWTFDLPSEEPPIEEAGYYSLAAVLTYPGTCDWVCDFSSTPFSYGLAGPSTDITMVSIPAGSFLMGSLDEEDEKDGWSRARPQRTVNISAFQMSETEVTQRQWEDVMDWNESWFKDDDHPVEWVTWFDCIYFCNELSEAHGHTKCYTITNMGYDGNHISSAEVSCDFEANGYRLPTEAEWEYACRAGTATQYYWGDSSEESIMKQYCWHTKNACSGRWTHPHADEWGTQSVGLKIPNAFGLYDMSGNVSEQCWDWSNSDYYGSRPDPDSDPTGPSSGYYRASRGGSWGNGVWGCRSATRGISTPERGGFYGGFRVVRRPAN